jgi:hypothetical protein
MADQRLKQFNVKTKWAQSDGWSYGPEASS